MKNIIAAIALTASMSAFASEPVKAETKPAAAPAAHADHGQMKAEAKPEAAKAEAKPEAAKAEAKPEAAKVEKKAEKKAEKTAAETK